jgi:hypothetical protein
MHTELFADVAEVHFGGLVAEEEPGGHLLAAGPVGFSPGLSEGEAVSLSAGVGEGDLEGALGDGAGLAD